jgi:hypothetical protein
MTAMKTFFALALTLLLATACSTAPTPAEAPAQAAASPAPAPTPEPDSIQGQVTSDDEVQGVPPHVEVHLFFGSREIAHQKADEYGYFQFDGPLEKGNYELTVHAGALHGKRALTYSGGALKDVSVVIAKPEHRRHRRHRR